MLRNQAKVIGFRDCGANPRYAKRYPLGRRQSATVGSPLGQGNAHRWGLGISD